MQSVMAILQAIIFAISSLLFLPVMIGLVLLSAWCAAYAGYIASEWFWRIKWRKSSIANVTSASIATMLKQKGLIFFIASTDFSKAIRQFCRRFQTFYEDNSASTEQHIYFLLQEAFHNLSRNVDRLKLVVRIGPALGLMGTLIPMSTGLQALSQGDLTQVSSSLVVAFTTTVVGLTIGLVAQIFAVAKSRWANEDIQYMQLIAEAYMLNLKNINFCNTTPEPANIVAN